MVLPHAPYPPRTGGRMRQWAFLNFLAPTHAITLLYFARPADPPLPPAVLAPLCERVLAVPYPQTLSPEDRAIGAGAPPLIALYGVAAMRQALAALPLDAFEHILVQGLYLTVYDELLTPRTILDEHNIESEVYRQYVELRSASPGVDRAELRLWRANWLSLARYENEIWPRVPLRLTVSEADRAELDRRCQVGRTLVVENGVDVDAVAPLPDQPAPVLLLMGTLSYFPNLDAAFYFVREILPRVWADAPQVRLLIAGHAPPAALAALAADPRIELVADPPDMHAVAARACATVVPLRLGGGTRLKILESLALARPVVSTPRGAAGLALTDGEQILLRDDPEAFARALVTLVSDAALRQAFASRGRAFVERRYAWSRVLQPLATALTVRTAAPVLA